MINPGIGIFLIWSLISLIENTIKKHNITDDPFGLNSNKDIEGDLFGLNLNKDSEIGVNQLNSDRNPFSCSLELMEPGNKNKK